MHNCIECDKPVDLRAGDEITPEIGRIAPDYGEIELCRACFSKGWDTNVNEIAFDDELASKIKFVSPIQPL